MSPLLPGQQPGEAVSQYAMRVLEHADVRERTMLALVVVLESHPLWANPEQFAERTEENALDYEHWLRLCAVLHHAAERLALAAAQYVDTEDAS